MPASGQDRQLAREVAKTLAMTAARNNPGVVMVAAAVAFVIFILAFLSSLVALSASHLPPIYERGPGPYARAKIPADILAVLTDPRTKRECPSLDWSILGAIVLAEADAGRNIKGIFGPNPLPRDPASAGIPIANRNPSQGQDGPSVQRTDIPGSAGRGADGSLPIYMFTSDDPGMALPLAGKLDWVAVKVGGPDAATPEEIQQLKDAGIPVVIWQDYATQDGAAAVEQYGAIGYIAQAEGPGQFDAALAVEDQIGVPKWLVTNLYMQNDKDWDKEDWPDGWGAMPEAYSNTNPNATPAEMKGTAIRLGAPEDSIIITTGSYDPRSENPGGSYVSLEKYARDIEALNVAGMAVFRGETLDADDHAFLNGLDGSAPSGGGRNRGGGGPRIGITQFVITFYDRQGHRQVVKFRVRPDVTPEGEPKAPGFNNPDNPWDKGYAGEINSDVARMYGWSGALVEGWDYEAGAPKYEIDPKTKKRTTKYKYNPGTRGPKGDKIPYYRVPDGQGYALDGDGDGDGDINNPADAIPMLARYLCANGAATHAKLMTAVHHYRPTWWYLYGGNISYPKFPGIFVLGRRLIAGGPLLTGRSAPTTWTNLPGGPSCIVGTTIDGRPMNDEQMFVAQAIIRRANDEAREHHLSLQQAEKLRRLGLMTSLQETRLKNPDTGLPPTVRGAFQQMPPWGTEQERMDPYTAAGFFFDRVLAIDGWYLMPYFDLAVKVQAPVVGPGGFIRPVFDSWENVAVKLLGGGAPNPACETNRGAPGLVKMAPEANFDGRPVAPETLDFLAEVAHAYGQELICSVGTRHNQFVKDTTRESDHWSGHACDFYMVDNGGNGDAIAAAALIVVGVPQLEAVQMARAGGAWNFNYKGLRVQIIWKSMEGGNHYDHVHIGANPF